MPPADLINVIIPQLLQEYSKYGIIIL